MISRHPSMAALLLVIAALPARAEPTDMQVIRNGSQSAVPGPAENFTGDVRIEMQFKREGEARLAGAVVSFAPGARTAWHTHPRGQTLIITAGKGWSQVGSGPVVELLPGDVVLCPPGKRHWHGATPTTAMSHIALHEAKDGQVVTWLEKVSDAQYLSGPGSSN